MKVLESTFMPIENKLKISPLERSEVEQKGQRTPEMLLSRRCNSGS
ncbi:hypothetical protein [Methanosarcina sp. UBA289]|nr:hypothetical protein [Methanosarcina sp. UBA289]